MWYIRIPHENFRGTVLDCPTERVKQFAPFQVSSWAEVDQLDSEVLSNHNVLVLDVPVNDAFWAQVPHCWQQLEPEPGQAFQRAIK